MIETLVLSIWICGVVQLQAITKWKILRSTATSEEQSFPCGSPTKILCWFAIILFNKILLVAKSSMTSSKQHNWSKNTTLTTSNLKRLALLERTVCEKMFCLKEEWLLRQWSENYYIIRKPTPGHSSKGRKLTKNCWRNPAGSTNSLGRWGKK